MKKKIAVIVLFAVLLVLPSLVWLFAGDSLKDLVTVDDKKADATFPAWDTLTDSNTFFAGVENWFEDRMAFKDMMTVLYRDTESKTGTMYQDTVKTLFNALHVHRYETVTVAATCLKGGYSEEVCICKDVKNHVDYEALGHHYEEEVVPATCGVAGYTVHTCSGCGESYTDTPTEALTHEYTKETVKPTCTENGFIRRTCTHCGKVVEEYFGEAFGHNYEDTVVAPTCTAGGYTTHVCARCNDTYTSDSVPATGHAWGEWVVTKEASTSQTGVRERSCTVCKEKQTLDIPVLKDGHVHSYAKQTVAPTCTESGYDRYTCACGDTYTGGETAPTHQYTTVETAPTCIKGGKRVYTCSVCGDTYEERIDAYGHDYGEPNVVEVTCLEDGYSELTCKRCGKSRRSDYVRATGHDWGEFVTVRMPTNKQTGLRTKTCNKCGEVMNVETPKIEGERTGYTNNGKTKLPIGGLIDMDFVAALATFTVQDDIQTNSLNNWNLYVPAVTLAEYQGSNLPSEADLKRFADALQAFTDYLAGKGKQFVFTVCPNKESVYSEYMNPAYPIYSETSRTETVFNYLAKNTSVKAVFCVEDLMMYKQTYQVWFKHDTHWNSAGGYIEAMNVLEALGMNTVDLYDVELEAINRYGLWMQKGKDMDVLDNQLGATVRGNYDKLGDIATSKTDYDDTDYIIHYLPDITLTLQSYYNRRTNEGGKYVQERLYTNPEYTNAVITSTNKNGKSMCFIGDSFRRAVVPFLAKNFTKFSHYHHGEFFGVNGVNYPMDDNGAAFAQNIREADVIVLEYVERGWDINGVISHINEIMKILGD